MSQVNYVVGFDVGLFSVGCCALEVDQYGTPIRILSAISHIHDSGVAPDSRDSGDTRLSNSGLARRTRRLYHRRSRRMKDLEDYLRKQNWETKPFSEYSDPYFPWRVRASLATEKEPDPALRGEMLSVAIRHIAGHRGWRNPYTSIRSLYSVSENSAAFEETKQAIEEASKLPVPDDATVGQAICLAEIEKVKIRGKENKILSSRLLQSDLANEIWKIASVQELSEQTTKEIIDHVFFLKSPKGEAAKRAGKDPLDSSEHRALKATNAFQRYRIITVLSNLRIEDGHTLRSLTSDELQTVFNYLLKNSSKTNLSWKDVADQLGIPRNSLRGTARATEDGEVSSSRPPIHETEAILTASKIQSLKDFWNSSNQSVKDELVQALSNSGEPNPNTESGNTVKEFLSALDDLEVEKLDLLHLPIGRAAYSEKTLNTLTERILSTGEDLVSARSACFSVPLTWVPPKPRISEPVGNPAVDRVLKIVNRFLLAAESKWGTPKSVNIEHVRKGFVSAKTAFEIEKENGRRRKRKENVRVAIAKNLNIEGPIRRSYINKEICIQRQNGQCAYCGDTIGFTTAEMDHIVPRAGMGSTNKRENLVAVCSSCNRSKGDKPFALWAAGKSNPSISVAEAVKRTKDWLRDSDLSPKQFNDLRRQVQTRLKRVDADEEIDARSIESVAWMATELRARIAQHYVGRDLSADPKVRVFKGSITAEARKASGLEKRLEYIGGERKKTRLDRRHHAVDAAVISLMHSYIAETLTIRANLRESQRYTNQSETWKEFRGSTPEKRAVYTAWLGQMNALTKLLQEALDKDLIPVTKNLRLRFSNGRAHADNAKPVLRVPVGNELKPSLIQRSASEAQWVALTRHPDFDPKAGLPADQNRTIRIHGDYLSADDELTFFSTASASLMTSHGAVEIGTAIHHARIYRFTKGKSQAYGMIRVFSTDLLSHRNEDLFSVELKPQSVSMRYANSSLTKAIEAGNAEYLGWVVTDDELYIPNVEVAATDKVKTLLNEYGLIVHWTIDGFPEPSRIRLRPRLMSKEGLPKDADPAILEILGMKGWQPSVSVVFGSGDVQVVRRNQLGDIRYSSKAHHPVTWTVK